MAALAPFAFVLLWSSSFVGSKIGLRHISPLTFVAIRQVACALVLTLLMFGLRRSWRSLGRRRWMHCAIAGVLVNGLGLMPSHIGLTLVSAAPIALVQSLNPLLTAAVGTVLLRERLNPVQWIGMILGLLGVALVVGIAAMQSSQRLEGLLLGAWGTLGICAGTLYFGRFCRGIPLLPGATAQFLAAGLVCAACAGLFETPRAEWTASAAGAVAWNTLAVSLGGMALYFFMLARGVAAQVAANFYLIPGTVAVLGWVFLGERLTSLAIVGFIVASIGCALVNGRSPWSVKSSAHSRAGGNPAASTETAEFVQKPGSPPSRG